VAAFVFSNLALAQLPAQQSLAGRIWSITTVKPISGVYLNHLLLMNQGRNHEF
jgi:hypothetical protein